MRKRTIGLLLLALLGTAVALAAVSAAQAPVRLEEADRFYEQGSYAKALPRYEQALAEGTAGNRKTELEYRVLVGLGRMQRWGDAFARTQAFLKEHPSGLWGARGNYWLGQLYLLAPHQGYRVGDRLYRGENYPKVEGAEKPQQVWLEGEDRKNGQASFEQAKKRYEGLRPRVGGEEADLNFDLARVLAREDLVPLVRVLQTLAKEKRPELRSSYVESDRAAVNRLRKHDWTVRPSAAYSATLPPPQRIQALYQQIERLDPGRAPQARLARALYLRQYQEQMRELMRAYDRKKHDKQVLLPFPYQRVEALALLESVAADFPRDAVAPQAQYLAGQWLEGRTQFVKALKVYREVLRRWPKSKWVSDAKAHIQAIEWPSLSLNAPSTPPGNAVKIGLGGRNVKTVSFRARAVDLEKLILDPKLLDDPQAFLGDFPRLAAMLEKSKWQGARLAASWTYVTKDTGKHQFLSEVVKAPLSQRGAYVITADAGEAHASTLLLISDLAIVEKTDRSRALLFVCDARTGAPVPGAQVVVKEIWWKPNHSRSDVARGQTNAEGLASKRFASPQDREVNAFAWVGDRYAITPSTGTPGGEGRHREYRGYVTTDRPVYRPGHEVQFRVVVGVRTVEGEDPAGSWRAAKEEPFEVTVIDPRGAKVHQATLTTSEFGSLNGAFVLGAEPPLGEYQMQVRVPKKGVEPFYQISGNVFRVEEYKKPEFEVTVTPAAEQTRVGQEVKAKLAARYYFGSPVVGGQVKYRVFKTPYFPQFRFPRPYDWLTASWEGEGYWYAPPPESGEVVKQGEGTTDAEGQLALTIPTAGGGQWPNVKAYTYTVSAEVTDPSRRTITGTGAVRASKQQFFAFLDVPCGFYEAGSRIEVEVATRDVMERPVAATGRVRVERVVRGAAPNNEDIVEARVYEGKVTTDRAGRAFFRWTPKHAGNYRFTFIATDEWEAKVTARAYTWVHGPDFDRVTIRRSGIELIPEKRTYEEGATARLLIISSFPGATVFLTQDAGPQVLARSVLPLKGKSRVVEVKLNRGHVPDFTFSALAVHDWQAFEASAEVFVPPARRFLSVAVSADRKAYRPGEQAVFRVKARDFRGRPVRTELSLGVIDASVLYIQQDYAPDPRLAFYGDRRWTDVPRTWSREWEAQPISRTDRTPGKYGLHEWRLPKGMGQIETWPVDLVGNSGWGDFDGGYVTLDDATAAVRRDPMLTFVPPAPPAMPEQRVALPMATTWQAAKAPALGSLQYQGGEMRGVVRLGSGEQPGGPRGPVYTPGPPGRLAAAQVRTRFADTAYWGPAVVTNEKGEETVKVTMPENLTTWKATARGVTAEFQVGQGSGEAVTRKDLIVRLQAPRFFMERDLVALSANVHNYLKSEKQVKVTLALDGGTVEVVSDPPANLGLKAAREPSVWVTVPKDGERRVDWVVRVLRSGTASVRMTAQSDEESDATELQFPALVHGVEKFVAQSGVMRDVNGTQTATLHLDLPVERQRGASVLNVQLTPSLAAVALDALPYLVDYPYGCIEQTMSRFLPTVVVARTLTDLGVNLDELRRRAEAQASRTTEAKTYGASAYTYPKGHPGEMKAPELASEMYLRRGTGPVFDRAEMDRMVRDGLSRIYSQQHEDGGWGWWPEDVSDPYMSAYVVHGLFTARKAGYETDNNVLERGFKFLMQAMKEHDNLHRVAYLASVVTLREPVEAGVRKAIAVDLYEDRGRLTAYSQALLALALKQLGETEKARVVVDNLESTANIDRQNGTANWRPRQQGWWWWHWWDNPVETNAAALRAYLAVEPDSDLVPMIVKWLVNNRRGNHWQSTKETALAVYALADFIRVKKELAPDYTVTVDLGGKVQRAYRVDRGNALLFDNRFIVGDEVLGDGSQPLTITVNGNGTLYYSAYLSYFSREEDVTGGGNEIFVKRRYFRLTPRLVEKKEKDRTWRELTYDREELRSGAALKGGDLVEVELILDAKNDYEYVVFEDMKPAGCEPVEVRSGTGEGEGVYSQMELRDEKVAFFISDLPQGTRAVRYRLRAEIPGVFHALPTNGYSMYAPDVRCLSDEWRATVGEGTAGTAD